MIVRVFRYLDAEMLQGVSLPDDAVIRDVWSRDTLLGQQWTLLVRMPDKEKGKPAVGHPFRREVEGIRVPRLEKNPDPSRQCTWHTKFEHPVPTCPSMADLLIEGKPFCRYHTQKVFDQLFDRSAQ